MFKKINIEAYQIAKTFNDLRDASDGQPLHALMESLLKLKYSNGEIALSSSFVNYCVLLANHRRNPEATIEHLEKMKFSKDIIASFIKASNKIDISQDNIPKNAPLAVPTFSELASSWKDWGVSSTSDPTPGDICVFPKHVSFFQDFTRQKNYQVLIADRFYKVKTEAYMAFRLIDIRRGKV